MAATVVEALAHDGITQVLGYGYAGSLTRTVPIGTLVLAEDALISDGTSRAYLPQATRGACSKTSSSRRYPGYWEDPAMAPTVMHLKDPGGCRRLVVPPDG